MKIYQKNFGRPIFIAIFILTFFICLQAQTKTTTKPRWDWQKHQTEIIDYAKNFLASNIESDLPQTSFAKWIQKVVGTKTKVNWSLADCGLQNPVLTKGIKLNAPMCVETTAHISGNILLHILIQYGTFELGITEKKPIVWAIFFGENAFSSPEKLVEVSEKVRSLKQSLILFDPNHGEFEISGKKPLGFRDFSTIWFRTVDYDSNNKFFPIKKHGDIEAGGKHFELRRIFFDGKSWRFETAIIGGISYKFAGKFTKLKLDRYGAVDGNKVLRGHLIKFVKGKKTAEADLFFNFYETGDSE